MHRCLEDLNDLYFELTDALFPKHHLLPVDYGASRRDALMASNRFGMALVMRISSR